LSQSLQPPASAMMLHFFRDSPMFSQLAPRLRLALAACEAVGPTITGEICFRDIRPEFKAKGVTYRDLAKLARLGYLTRTGEGRYAVYYRITRATSARRRPTTSRQRLPSR
jgi:hypothetical protein